MPNILKEDSQRVNEIQISIAFCFMPVSVLCRITKWLSTSESSALPQLTTTIQKASFNNKPAKTHAPVRTHWP